MAGAFLSHISSHPLTSGIEFFGGLFLLLGLLTRISAGALGVTMIVAIKAAKWSDVDSLETLLGFDEFEYLALFLWLAIAGAGALFARCTNQPMAGTSAKIRRAWVRLSAAVHTCMAEPTGSPVVPTALCVVVAQER